MTDTLHEPDPICLQRTVPLAQQFGHRYPSERSKSQLYSEFLPMMNSRQVELLDVPRLARQLEGLERRTARGGRDSIDHGPGGHDDVANVVAGVCAELLRPWGGHAVPGDGAGEPAAAPVLTWMDVFATPEAAAAVRRASVPAGPAPRAPRPGGKALTDYDPFERAGIR
jgi:hypothetical protein